jgi:hypothetical protein
LRTLSARIHKRQDEVRKLEEECTELVAHALEVGMPHTQVAEVSGLTRGRVGQLAMRPPTPRTSNAREFPHGRG